MNLDQAIESSVVLPVEIEVNGEKYTLTRSLHNLIIQYHRDIIDTQRDGPYNFVAGMRIVKKNYQNITTRELIIDLIGDCFYKDDGVKVFAGKVIDGIHIEKFSCQFSQLQVVLDILALYNQAKWSINADGSLDFY